MLCSTAADLIPTYLQMPLINKVLIPRQFEYAWLYIVGFAGAWILTWLLTWARTYVLAYASEAIAADLRNRTYAHLQSLSIDYFGGKRTGDLIARVSTDTDRICYFLSVYVLDFANDLLMLVMTAALLLSINYKLAIVSLVPLPVIAYSSAQGSHPFATRFSIGHPDVGRNDQRLGRYYSRHPRGQGLCPGTPRNRPLQLRPTTAYFRRTIGSIRSGPFLGQR